MFKKCISAFVCVCVCSCSLRLSKTNMCGYVYLLLCVCICVLCWGHVGGQPELCHKCVILCKMLCGFYNDKSFMYVLVSSVDDWAHLYHCLLTIHHHMPTYQPVLVSKNICF